MSSLLWTTGLEHIHRHRAQDSVSRAGLGRHFDGAQQKVSGRASELLGPEVLGQPEERGMP